MNKVQRVRAALAGAEVDRPPYGFWTHMPGIDLDPDRLAEETAAFYRRFDLDFVKSMPNGLYCVEDWGAVCDYSEIAKGGVAKVTSLPINKAEDWWDLDEIDVTNGAFGRELHHLGQLARAIGDEAPVLATVFSPATVAGKLSNGAYRQHLEADPAAVAHGLEVITRGTERFVREALDRGCAGVFFAAQEAVESAMDADAYERAAAGYDRQVLAAAADGWFNVVHMHGDDIHFDLLKDYPVTALNWHIGETPPSIADYRECGGRKPIVGGLIRKHLTEGDLDAALGDLRKSVDETGGRGLLVSPACVIRHPVIDEVLLGVAEAIRGTPVRRS